MRTRTFFLSIASALTHTSLAPAEPTVFHVCGAAAHAPRCDRRGAVESKMR